MGRRDAVSSGANEIEKLTERSTDALVRDKIRLLKMVDEVKLKYKSAIAQLSWKNISHCHLEVQFEVLKGQIDLATQQTCEKDSAGQLSQRNCP